MNHASRTQQRYRAYLAAIRRNGASVGGLKSVSAHPEVVECMVPTGEKDGILDARERLAYPGKSAGFQRHSPENALPWRHGEVWMPQLSNTIPIGLASYRKISLNEGCGHN